MTNAYLIMKSLCLCVLTLTLISCGGSRTYSSIEPGAQSPRSRAALELPPDLVDTTSDSLLASQAQQAQTQEVLPESESLDIGRNDDEGWLDVDAPVNQVWSRLVSHWGALGVDLVISDPKTGIMETDWVKPAKSKENDQGLTGNLVNQFLGRLVDAPTSLDKYTIQLERKGDSSTRIRVTHKGIKKIQTQRATVATNAEYEWVETEEDPEKVRRALLSITYGLDAGES